MLRDKLTAFDFWDLFEELFTKGSAPDLEKYLKSGETLTLKAKKEAESRGKAYSSFIEFMANSQMMRKNPGKGKKLYEATVNMFRGKIEELESLKGLDAIAEGLAKLKEQFFPSVDLDVYPLHWKGCPYLEGHESTAQRFERVYHGTPIAFVDEGQCEDRSVLFSSLGSKLPQKTEKSPMVWLEQTNGSRRRRGSESFTCADAARVMALLTITHEANSYLAKRCEEVKSLEEPIYPFSQTQQNAVEQIFLEQAREEILTALQKDGGESYTVLRGNTPEFCMAADYIEENLNNSVGIDRYVVFRDAKEGRAYKEEHPNARQDILSKTLREYIPSVLAGKNVAYDLPQYYYRTRKGNLIANAMFEDRGMIMMPAYEPGCQNAARFACDLVAAIIQAATPVIEQNRITNSESKNHARSFETKAAIPAGVLEYMANSDFNKFFGYVEIDEDCDLDKVTEAYKIFEAFNEIALKQFPPHKDHALRFRRLGNHKAAGLYYPGYKCLCVDINDPSSFIHEYGHMIDYTMGDLSQKAQFARVYALYKESFEKYISKHTEIKLTSKYGKGYYLMPTEVFARCFEMYFTRIRKYSNPLLGNCDGFAYPCDDELEKAIKIYFEGILGLGLPEKEETGKENEPVSIDKWQYDDQIFEVSAATTDGETFYVAKVGSRSFEYDSKPDRKRVEDDYIDAEAMAAIDRHEAELDE